MFMLPSTGLDYSGRVGSFTDRNTKRPLTWSSFKGNFNIVVLLIDGGADISLANGAKKTALDYAIEKGHQKTKQLLNQKLVQIKDFDERS